MRSRGGLRLVAVACAVLLLLPAAGWSSATTGPSADSAELSAGSAAREILVKYKPGAGVRAVASVRRTRGARLVERMRRSGLDVLRVGPHESVTAALARLGRNPLVEYVARNTVRRIARIPNDKYYNTKDDNGVSYQWNLRTVKAAQGWNRSWGKPSVPIAVIDTGIDPAHEDLASRLWTNPSTGAHGWNFVGSVQDGVSRDGKNYIPLGQSFSNRTYAQSFKPYNDVITKAAIAIKKVGSGTHRPVTVSVRQGGATPNSATELARFRIDESEVAEDSDPYETPFVEKSLDVTVPVSNPTATYYLVVSTDSDTPGNYYQLGDWNWSPSGGDADARDIDAYPFGKRWRSLDGGLSWQPDQYHDLAFGLTDPSRFPQDEIGHGTHVAGIAAAATNNSKGIAGIAGGWGAQAGSTIMPLKVTSAQGVAEDAYIIEAIHYAADNGAKVINMSLSGPDASEPLAEAINYAHSKGVVVVSAAGNQEPGESFPSPQYPAAYPHVIGVGATDRFDHRSSWSNWWPHLVDGQRVVDVAAPGSSIASAIPSYLTPAGYAYYARMSGTSMASPHVAGLAALIRSVYPGMDPHQVENRIKERADDLGPRGRDPYYGWGRINIIRSLDVIPPSVAIAAPQVFAHGSGRSARLAFSISDNVTRKLLVEMRIEDRYNRTVRRLGPKVPRFYRFAGNHVMYWDGRNGYGRLVRAGMYHVHLVVWDDAGNPRQRIDYVRVR